MKFKNMLKKEILKYEKIGDKVKYDKFENLEGSLIICDNEYYHKLKNKTKNKFEQKYIKKINIKFAQNLAQKSYNKKIKKLVNKVLPLLRKLYYSFDENLIDEVYERYSDKRKKLVIPVMETKVQYIENWKNKPYHGKGFDIGSNHIFTNNGQRVRSKTEKILADKFEFLNIPYKYECPLNLGDRVIYPDFTFLDPHTCEEIYWEHFGMMDNPQYVENAIKKIESYSMNGLKLICTFETLNRTPNNHYVDWLINEHLMD